MRPSIILFTLAIVESQGDYEANPPPDRALRSGESLVVSGGLFNAYIEGLDNNAAGWGDQPFLTALYANGGQGSMDAIGAHPYPWTPEVTWDLSAASASIARLRAARDAAGDAARPIWVTEAGESTASAVGFPTGAALKQQSSDLISLVQYFIAQPDIPVAFVHRLVDQTAVGSVEAGFGVFTANGTAKPAACALSQLWHGALRC